jgi:hypothetical protein
MVDDDGDSDGDGGDDYGADDGVDDEGDDDEDDYDDDNDVMTMMTMMTIKIMIVIGTVTCNELVSILRCEWTSAMSFSASLPQLCPFMSPCPPAMNPTIFAQAGGTGLTLTAATHVIHFDRQYNPAIEAQAMRIRPGQRLVGCDRIQRIPSGYD